MALVVEILSRTDRAVEHHYFDQNSISVGRGFNSDLRIDDPYVSASHLTITKDPANEQIHFNDHHSRNGVRLNGNRTLDGDLASGDILTVGRTRLRVFDADEAVPDALYLSPLEENLGFLNRLWFCFIAVCAFVVMVVSAKYLTTYTPIESKPILSEVMVQLIALSIWPVLLTLLAKVVKKDSHLTGLLSLSCLFVLTLQALSLVERWLGFNLIATGVMNVFSALLMAVLLIIFIWFSLFIAFHQHVRTRNLITLTLAALILVPTFLLKWLGSDNFTNAPGYSVTLLPPQYSVISGQTTDDFIAQSDDLFDAVDRLREKARKED